MPGVDVDWPSEFAARYRDLGYWAGRTLGERLREWSARDPDRLALVAGASRFTYGELDLAADRRAAGLYELGLRAGDRVVIQLPNVAEFAVLLAALLRLGVLPVLALPAHRASEIGYLCELTEAAALAIPDVHAGFDHRDLARALVAPTLRHVLVAGEAAEFTDLRQVDAEPRDLPGPRSDEVALYLLSGGTTGLPKLIPRTHDDYDYNLRASAAACGFTEDTVYLATLPIEHNFPLACPGMLGTWHAGGTVVLATSPSPDDAFPLIEREGVTVTAVVPPVALLWMEAAEWFDADLSSLRLLQVGGARLQPEAAARVGPVLGCALQQVYGMAEGLLNYTAPDDSAWIVENTQGRPLCPDDELRIVDADGADVPDGEVGELLTRGPYTLRGYHRAPETNARAFTQDGFYRTGDLVRRLPSGHLVVTGRVKDVINRGGEKVPAEEVENLLLGHPAVHDVALVGLPDPMLGERTCAVVVPRGAAPTLPELLGYLRERGVAAFKYPDLLETVSEMPRTSVGKVSKQRLVDLLASR